MTLKQNAHYTTLANMPTRLAAVLDEQRKTTAKTRAKLLLKDDAKAKHIDVLIAESKQRLTTLQRQAEDAFQALQVEVNKQTRQPAGDTQTQLLREMRQQRAWDRVKAQLEAAGNDDTALLHTVRTVTSGADLDTVFALRQELPAWLASKKKDGFVSTAEQELATAYRGHLTAEQQIYLNEAEELERNYKRVQTALKTAEADLLRSDRETYLPSFEPGGEMLTVEAVPDAIPEVDAQGNRIETLGMPVLGTSY